jgi:hypothetical protein
VNRTHATPRRLAGGEGFYHIVDPRPRVGAVAEVFEGRSPSGLPVAIKVARDVDRAGPVLSTERRVREAVQAREPRAAEWLSSLLDTGEDELGRPFLVHPWFDFNLVEWMEADPDPGQRLAVAELAARTIGYVHRCNLSVVGRLVHRSLKPATMLVKVDSSERPTQVVLSNLGQAGARGPLTFLSSPPEDMQGFLPPEQMMPIQSTPDATMDMHAVAAIVVWVLTGRAPQSVLSRGTMLGNVGARAADLLARPVRLPEEDARLADLLRYPLHELYRLDLMAPLDRFDEQRILMAVVPEAAPVDIGRRIGDAAHSQLIPALRHALHPRLQERARDTRRLVSALSAVRKLADMVPVNRVPRARRVEPDPYTEPMTDPGRRAPVVPPIATMAPKPSALDQDAEDTVIFCPDVDLSELKRIWDEKRARQQVAATVAATRPARRPGELRDLTEANETVIVALEAEIRTLRAELKEQRPAPHLITAVAKTPSGNKGGPAVKAWKAGTMVRPSPPSDTKGLSAPAAETSGRVRSPAPAAPAAASPAETGSTKATVRAEGARAPATPRSETSGPVKAETSGPIRAETSGGIKAETSGGQRAETSGRTDARRGAKADSRGGSASKGLEDPRTRPPEPPPFQRPASRPMIAPASERPIMAAEATMDLPVEAITEMLERGSEPEALEPMQPPRRKLPPPTRSATRTAPPEPSTTPIPPEPPEADTVIWRRDFDVSDLQDRWSTHKAPPTPLVTGLPEVEPDVGPDPEERMVTTAPRKEPRAEQVQSVSAIPALKPAEPAPLLRQSRDEAHDRAMDQGMGRGVLIAGMMIAVLLAVWIVLRASPPPAPPPPELPPVELAPAPVPPPLGAGPVGSKPALPSGEPAAASPGAVPSPTAAAATPAAPEAPAPPVAMPPAALPLTLSIVSDLNPKVEVNGMALTGLDTLLTAGSYQVKYTWEKEAGNPQSYELEVTLQMDNGLWTVLAGSARTNAVPGKRVILNADPAGVATLEVQPIKAK